MKPSRFSRHAGVGSAIVILGLATPRGGEGQDPVPSFEFSAGQSEPNTRRPELEDRQALGGSIVRPTPGLDAAHAKVLDLDLPAKERDLLA